MAVQGGGEAGPRPAAHPNSTVRDGLAPAAVREEPCGHARTRTPSRDLHAPLSSSSGSAMLSKPHMPAANMMARVAGHCQGGSCAKFQTAAASVAQLHGDMREKGGGDVRSVDGWERGGRVREGPGSWDTP